ncbi:helix-turn-helix domain-containing protein [Rhodoferax sp. U2-2l]|uniref:helix-turn-helix domain-containing protein n=1 Tax=Rhodoferax sp. U2-2l TaxID=2884000 RepID=UPI001D0B4AD9|nr:helix-turn-helix transcriptional regulator [Rhodoferax sp. U2-2l]MCB8748347.1 helix-turn-helix domain-containing protein [Rhodoferax sp. U2-2l]
MQISERIKSERKRLGYSQTDMAEIAEASRGTVANWENGIGGPDANALSAMARVGVDVLYVITGDRSFEPPRKLTSEEETMLGYFKEASPAARRAAVRELLSATPGEAPKPKDGNNQVNNAPGSIQVRGSGNKVMSRTRK